MDVTAMRPEDLERAARRHALRILAPVVVPITAVAIAVGLVPDWRVLLGALLQIVALLVLAALAVWCVAVWSATFSAVGTSAESPTDGLPGASATDSSAGPRTAPEARRR